MTIPLEIRRRVFIKGLNWVGDSIMATPALRKLRRAFDGSHITLMVRPWVAALYEHNPDIDELWVEDDSGSFRSFLAVARKIRKGKFDFGIALPNSFRSAALLMFGQIKHRIGYARGKRSLLLTRRVKVTHALLTEHEVHYYLNLIDWMTDEKPEAPELVLHAGEKERTYTAALIGEKGLDRRRMLVGIAPGSINSTAKRWLPERFAQLADRFHDEIHADVVLLGSDREKEVLDEVEGLCKTPVWNLGGQLSLAQFIALMERLHAFIGNDSGAMHMAAAFGVPSVVIFGPTDWRTTSPFSSKSKVIRNPVDCSPCMFRTCPIEHPCMTGVKVEDIVHAFVELAPDIKERRKAMAAP